MTKETINWHTGRKLPKVDLRNRLNSLSVLAEKNPERANKPYQPVLIFLGDEVVAGRFFTKKIRSVRWYSLQGLGYPDNEVKGWAEIPKGPWVSIRRRND
jgi:hypothetical protein